MTLKKSKRIRTRWKVIISLSGILLLFLAGMVLILPRVLRLENYKTEILEALQNTLHRRVIYDTGEFSFRFTPSFTFTNIRIMEKNGSDTFLSADRLTFRMSLFPLIRKRLVLSGMVMDRPRIAISRDASGEFNIGDLLKETGKAELLQIHGVKVKKGSLRFVDRKINPGGVVTSVESVDLTANRVAWGKGSDLKLDAAIVQGGKTAPVKIHGRIRQAGKGRPYTETYFSGSIVAGNLDFGHFRDYYSSHVPFRKADGSLDLDVTFKGTPAEFSSKGKVRMSGFRLIYPEVFPSVFAPKKLSVSYAMALSPKELSVSSLNLIVDGLNLKGNCSLKDIGTRDPFLSARASTAPWRLEEMKGHMPYGVIAKDVSDYIEQHIMGGVYKLDQGTLVGRISQIAHMGAGTNYNVLSVKGTVEKGIVSYGADVPTFNNIKGRLEMRGKDFILSGIQANFGSSPFTLEGRITDYPLSSPNGYPFTMNMKPHAADVAWLMKLKNTKGLVVSNGSTLSLKGNGTTSGYSLNGRWDLSPAALSYRDFLTKQAGLPSQVSFNSLITKDGTKIPVFRFDMAPLSITGSAESRSGKEQPLSFKAVSNDFMIQSLAPRLPTLARYHPAGKAHISVQGTGGAAGLEDQAFSGEITLSGASFKPSEAVKPVSNINGTVYLKGDTLKTSMLTAKLGNSTITGTAALNGFAAPTLNVVFSSPSIDLSDFGLKARSKDAHGKESQAKQVIVQKVHGDILLKKGSLTVKSLSGQINRSSMRVSGTIGSLRSPRAELVLNAAYLDMDDVALLSTLERSNAKEAGAGKVSKEGGAGRLSLLATVNADVGKIRRVEFHKLRGKVHYENKILYVEQAECAVLGGTFNGKGRMDFGTVGGTRYQTSFSLEKISAAQFLHVLETGREITGTMSIEGELTAKGETFDEMLSTFLGNVRFHCEKGSLKKFALLSKVFSILNVSQLLKFRLPDMVSGGMPYNEIKATFSFRDGIVKTDDLFIDSNAMNISIVGQFDLVRKQVDVVVGVKPLQTIDKVVSHIPVLGWVLTGKNKSLITTYFEAKGSLDNPNVKTIAAQSLAKGVFNIFKRVFSLPAKLFTDTGEVFINN